MDLLSTILRSCNAEIYIQNFKIHQVDSFTLKLLNHEDLEIIGVNDEEHRNNILKQIEKLQIPAEKKVNTKVDNQYVILALNQISLQLQKHYALLTYNLKRQDVDLCNVKVSPIATCLQNCLLNMENELDKFEQRITDVSQQNKTKKQHAFILPLIAASAVVLIFCRSFFILYR